MLRFCCGDLRLFVGLLGIVSGLGLFEKVIYLAVMFASVVFTYL